MKLIYLLSSILLVGCVSTPAPTPAPPPLPVTAKTMLIRQSARAAMSETLVAAEPVVPTNAPGYGTIVSVPVSQETGSTIPAAYLKWMNWPTNVPFTIQTTTNLVDWKTFVEADSLLPSTIMVLDLSLSTDPIKFYRIMTNGVSGAP
jgi:hypothetical protein